MIFLSSNMGSGKTDFALTLFEIYYDHFHRLEKAKDESVNMPEFAANFDVNPPKNVDFRRINEYPTFKEWVKDGKSETDNKAYFFDEGSSVLTAQSGENQEMVVKKMNELIKKARKGGVKLMIFCGHDGRDLAPLIRALCDYVEKPNTKKADFYQGVRNRQGVGHLFSVDGIPQTNWNYDTNDTAEWIWGEDAGDEITESDLREERNIRMTRMYETFDHITYEKLGQVYDLHPSTISEIINDLREEITVDTDQKVAEIGAD